MSVHHHRDLRGFIRKVRSVVTAVTIETSFQWPLAGSSGALQALVKTVQCTKEPVVIPGVSILNRENGL